eukprot:754171-Hanusia_phi.AAC.4
MAMARRTVVAIMVVSWTTMVLSENNMLMSDNSFLSGRHNTLLSRSQSLLYISSSALLRSAGRAAEVCRAHSAVQGGSWGMGQETRCANKLQALSRCSRRQPLSALKTSAQASAWREVQDPVDAERASSLSSLCAHESHDSYDSWRCHHHRTPGITSFTHMLRSIHLRFIRGTLCIFMYLRHAVSPSC